MDMFNGESKKFEENFKQAILDFGEDKIMHQTVPIMKEAFTIYGIEGTEDEIKRQLHDCPEIQAFFLKLYYKLLGRTNGTS